MEELRLSAVAARVVAWHNRHPLARRITAAQVHAIGYVALPFSDPGGALQAARMEPPPFEDGPASAEPEGGTLRERAQARARRQQGQAPTGAVPTVNQLAVDPLQLDADFSEDFIDPLSAREVARFARRRGPALVRAPHDGPVRRVRADGRQPQGGGLTLYLLTAVIETGTHKSRVLLGPGRKPAILGRRVFSQPRIAAVLLPLLAAGGWLVQKERAAHAPVAVAASPAPVAPASAAAPAEVHAPAASAPEVQVAHAAASAPAPAPEPAAGMPLDVEPRLGRIELPSLRPRLGPPSDAASAPPRTALAAASAASAAPVLAAAEPPKKPQLVPLPDEPAFALSTRLLRTRAEADQVRVAMRSLLKAISASEVRVDVMAEGDDWRVVGMPFASRAEADKARALLVSRGMRVEVVGF